MGQSPQRASRLHFRAAGISRKNADGPGPRKHWRARTRARGISGPCRRSGFAGSCTSSITFVRDSAGNSARGVARDFACQRGFAKCITAPGTADWRCFAITRTNGEHYSRRKQPCRTERADSQRALAHPDSRSAADVFCRVASCASLRAAQYQSRFEHAVVPIPLRKTTHWGRAFCRGVATFGFRCTTGRMGSYSDVRCEMCRGLFDGA